MEKTGKNNVLETLKTRFAGAVLECGPDKGDAVAVVDPARIHEIVSFLKDGPQAGFEMLADLCGVDYLPRTPRFEVVYQLHNLRTGERVRLRAQLEEKSCEIATISDLFPNADWLEREAWDMFGIVFTGHPNLKRLLMYEPFEGHPLRRDYPINKRQPLIGPKN
ncbi:MAG: NADH-quinone oxidoreductase subunit C [Candidatus Glassbacteria bacterium]|nr:NADH-quinone oxidoreductase subunit C [Candidatus Glassbacteria bacterium]